MTRLSAIAAAAVALALPAAAHAETASVDMFGSAFTPASVTVVAGDSVSWRNGDIAVHDVKSATFASGLVARFASFTQRFDAPGTVAYVCGLHIGMNGQVDVLAAKLEAPAGEAFAGETITLRGRTAPGTATVTIEAGPAWTPAATVTPNAVGSFKTSVEAATSYRARTAAGVSPEVTATVRKAPKIKLRVAKDRLKVTVTPAVKGLVARFEQRKGGGWRKFAAVKLDASGRASVKTREGKLRAVLLRGKTALATSATVGS